MDSPLGRAPFIRRHVISTDSQRRLQQTQSLMRPQAVEVEREPTPEGAKSDVQVLVINASMDMAREITVELSRAIPGCTIMFAPTLRLALWIINRRKIDLIVTSAILPDGSLSELDRALDEFLDPPELVVMSGADHTREQMSGRPGYRFAELRSINSRIREVGADLRNDLNNPLQEIVALAFVAQVSDGISPVAEQALGAIEKAAKNMSQVVNGLEDKILEVVTQG